MAFSENVCVCTIVIGSGWEEQTEEPICRPHDNDDVDDDDDDDDDANRTHNPTSLLNCACARTNTAIAIANRAIRSSLSLYFCSSVRNLPNCKRCTFE